MVKVCEEKLEDSGHLKRDQMNRARAVQWVNRMQMV